MCTDLAEGSLCVWSLWGFEPNRWLLHTNL
jgi:hypothetical protein